MTASSAAPDPRLDTIRKFLLPSCQSPDSYAMAALASLAADLAKAQAGCIALQGISAEWRKAYEETDAELAEARQALQQIVDLKGDKDLSLDNATADARRRMREIARAALDAEVPA